MKLNHFIKRYKQERRQAVPPMPPFHSESEIVPSSDLVSRLSRFFRTKYRITAAVCVCAVVIVMIAVVFMKPITKESLPVTGETDTPTVSDSPDSMDIQSQTSSTGVTNETICSNDSDRNNTAEENSSGTKATASNSKNTVSGQKLPSWYEPKTISLRSLTYTGTAIPSTTKFDDKTIGLNYLRITKQDSGYNYIDTNAKKTVNVNQLIEPIIKKNSIENGNQDYSVFCFSASKQCAMVEFNSSNYETFYYVDIRNGTCRKINKIAIKRGYGGAMTASPDFKKFLIHCEYNIFLYDLDKDTITDITKDASGKQIYACDDEDQKAYFSPTGRYIVFSTRDRQGGLSHGLTGCHVLYDWRTGKSTIIDGKVDYFTLDDTYIIAEQNTGGYKLRCDTMQREEITSQNTSVNDSTQIIYSYSGKGRQYYLTFYNLANAKADDVSNKPVCAYTLDKGHRYLYYYIKGESHVVCVNIATRQSFTVNVSREFINEIAGAEKSGIQVAYLSLFYDDDLKELLLCYELENRSDSTPDMAEPSPAEILQNSVSMYYALGSTAFSPRYLKYMEFYEGDGFIYCTVTLNGEVFVDVEDSRDDTITYYRHKGNSTNAPIECIQQRKGKIDLKALKQVLQGRNIPIKPAAMDYNRLKMNR